MKNLKITSTFGIMANYVSSAYVIPQYAFICSDAKPTVEVLAKGANVHAIDEVIGKKKTLGFGTALLSLSEGGNAEILIHSVICECTHRESLKVATRNIFKLANKANIETIALPALGTEECCGSLTAEEAVNAIFEVFEEFDEKEISVKEIHFITENKEAYSLMRSKLG